MVLFRQGGVMKTKRYVNGYVLLYRPEYKFSMQTGNWVGWVYAHKYVVQKDLGRKLRKDELVHHLDCNKRNNRRSNLIVLSKADHARLHGWIDGGASVHESYMGNGFNSEKSKAAEHRSDCLVCHEPLGKWQTRYCSHACAEKGKRKVKRPSKPKLSRLMAKYNWSELGRRYGVSDNAVRKWARNYELL